MAQVRWTGGSGSWGNVSNWGTAAPTADDSVTISSPRIAVTVGAGVSAVAGSLTTNGATLSLSGGTLYTVATAAFGGAFIETAGTYIMGGTGAVFSGGLTFTGGTMNILSGKLVIAGGATLGSGTASKSPTSLVSGQGTLEIAGGTTYLSAGFGCTASNWLVDNGGKLGFQTNFSYGGNFTLASNGVLDMFGHTLTLSGTSNLSGVIGYGTLIDSGSMIVGNGQNTTVFDNGAFITVNGTMTDAGNLQLGTSDAGAQLTIGAKGQFLIAGNWSITDPSSVAQIFNKGVFAKTFGGRLASINADFKSTGKINVASGTLLLNGPVNSLAGSVSGSGTLAIGGVETTIGSKLALTVAAFAQQSGELVLNNSLTFANEWDLTGGVFNLNKPTAMLTLNGLSNFDGGTLTGFGGKVLLAGTARAGNVTFGGPNTIEVAGTLDQSNSITLGLSSNTSVLIDSGASWLIDINSTQDNTAIHGGYGFITNNGTFADTNGSGNAVIQSEFVNNGTLTANNSTLTLANASYLGGTITGTGLLDLVGSTTLGNGLGISVAAVSLDGGWTSLQGNLAYAGQLHMVNGALLDLGGNTLTVSGRASLDSGTVTDNGVLALTGTVLTGGLTIDGSSELALTGTLEQSQNITIGDANGTASAVVEAGASWTNDTDAGIGGTGTLSVFGTLTESGTGTDFISPNLILTGVLQANDQMLITNGGILGGTVTGTGVLAIGGALTILESGLSLSVAGLEITGSSQASLTTNVSYANYFLEDANSTIALGGHTLSLTGTSVLSGNTTGPGVLYAGGTSTVTGNWLTGGGTLEIAGTAEQTGVTVIGFSNDGTLQIDKTATYTLDGNSGIGATILGNGTIDVLGTLSCNGNGLTTISPNVVDAGVISANLGTLSIGSAISGTGIFTIGSGGVLDFSGGATFANSNAISFTAAGGTLQIEDLNTFTPTVSNFLAGDSIVLVGLDGASATHTFTAGNTQILFGDGSGHSFDLHFGTAQSSAAITFSVNTHNQVVLTHS